jgi:hypothetical protein
VRLPFWLAKGTMQDRFCCVHPLQIIWVTAPKNLYAFTIVEPLPQQFNRPVGCEGRANSVWLSSGRHGRPLYTAGLYPFQVGLRFQKLILVEQRRSDLFPVRFQPHVELLGALNFWNRASAPAGAQSVDFFLAAHSSFFPLVMWDGAHRCSRCCIARQVRGCGGQGVDPSIAIAVAIGPELHVESSGTVRGNHNIRIVGIGWFIASAADLQ